MRKEARVFYVSSIIILFGLWEGIARLGVFPSEVLPSFVTTLRGSIQLILAEELPKHLLASGYRWAMGFSISLVLSVPAGIWMARSKRVYHFLDPLLTLTYPVPKAAMIPILMLWMGAGDLSKVMVIIIGCFIPLVISAYHGAQGVERSLIWSARAMGMGEKKILFRIILPASLPALFSGIRMALAISLIVVLGSEMIARQSGLGYYLFNSLEMGLYQTTYSVLIIISGIGFLLDRIFSLVMKNVLAW
ncbi:MAG: transporter permease, partial [Deltaproteobacteria bacterium]|nr:transporter permease [Deltaproteobacteria bacterium]